MGENDGGTQQGSELMERKKLVTARRMHYAASPKRALCGRRNPRATKNRRRVTCRMCKRWLRHLPGGSTFRPSPGRSKRINPKSASAGRTSALTPNPPKQFFQKLGQRIRLLRTKKGLTRGELATCCRLWTGHIGKIERGDHNITLVTLIRIAACLDVSPDSLLPASPTHPRSR